MVTRRQTAAALMASGFAVCMYAIAESGAYVVRRRTLTLHRSDTSYTWGTHMRGAEKRDAEKPHLRVLHLSDLHLIPQQHRKISFLKRLAELHPDVVILTGDLIASASAIDSLNDALKPLAHIPGVFVFGGNDYVAPRPRNPFQYLWRTTSTDDHNQHVEGQKSLPTDRLEDMLEQFGWKNAMNTRVSLDTLGIDVVGVADPHEGMDRFPAAPAPSDVDVNVDAETHANAAAGQDTAADTVDMADKASAPHSVKPRRLRFGVSHAPYQRVLNEMTADGCDAIFAGHTHGGQVCIPGFGALVTNCDIDRTHVAGLFSWPLNQPALARVVQQDRWHSRRKDGVLRYSGNMTYSDSLTAHASVVNICAGLGTNPFTPFRLACRPEVNILDIRYE
ncbi:MAG: metallophosphoesterase [Actinomycetaceae bacterium]|nr:metallophosphoesterase [Actinomycetaceae bacterium]MDY6082271.1 metallophosphoesterase [Actinomycetaceae bacterium]